MKEEVEMTYLIYAALVLFGLFYTVAAAMKLLKHPHFVEEFASMRAFSLPQNGMPPTPKEQPASR